MCVWSFDTIIDVLICRELVEYIFAGLYVSLPVVVQGKYR